MGEDHIEKKINLVALSRSIRKQSSTQKALYSLKTLHLKMLTMEYTMLLKTFRILTLN